MNGIDVWLVADAAPSEVTASALAAAAHAESVEREGAGPGSLTDEGLRYSVLDGPGVIRYASVLEYWLRRSVPALASACVGQPLGISPDLRTAINVNVLEGKGGSYELHTDPCPYSALLFCTGPHKGGEWSAWPHAEPGNQHSLGPSNVVVHPHPGDLLVFAGRIPHTVYSLEADEQRISVPVALYPLGTTRIERDPELDAHIFGEAA